MLEILGLVMPGITKVLDKLIPDTNARQAAQDEITKALIAQDGAVQQAIAEAAKAQTEVNLKEAESGSMFIAGWRPFIGWVCGVGCGYAFILQPLLGAFSAWMKWSLPPSLDTQSMLGLLMGMLGLGGMRTYEKTKGVERTAITPVNK